MTSSHEPPNPPPEDPVTPPAEPTPDSEIDIAEFESHLEAVGQSLEELRLRYSQVQADQQHQAYLEQQRDRTQRQLKQTQSLEERQALKQELKQIQRRLEELEIALESHLFSWKSLREPFWQAVRFGGLGIVIGWILKSCAG